MKILTPDPVNDKIELSREDVTEAIRYWLEEVHGRQLVIPIKVIASIGDEFRATGELTPLIASVVS